MTYKRVNTFDDGKLDILYQRERIEIPDEEHEEEVARHPAAWFIMITRCKI